MVERKDVCFVERFIPLPLHTHSTSLSDYRGAQMIMPSGSVPVIDLSKCPTPQLLANAVFKSLSTVGFLFITNHGLENQVEEMFTISGESTIRSRNEAS